MFSTILLTLIILLIYCWPSDTFRLDHIGDGSKPIIAILLPWGNKHPLTSVNLLQGLRQDDSHGAGQGWRAGGVPGEDWQDDRGESQRRPDFSDFFGKLDDIGGLFFWILVLRQAEELEKRVSLSFGIGGFRIFRDEWHPPGISLVLSWYSPWWGACVRPPVKKTHEFTWTSVLQPNFILQWKDMFNSWWEDLFEMLEVGFSIQGLGHGAMAEASSSKSCPLSSTCTPRTYFIGTWNPTTSCRMTCWDWRWDWVMIMNICEVLIPILKQYVKRCTSHHHWFLEGWLSHNSRSLGPDETVRSKVVHRLNTWHQSSCAWPAASAGFKLGLVVETWEDGWN